MPWKLVPPHTRKDGKRIESWYARGRYCGIRLDHSLDTRDEDAAKRIFTTWCKQAERGTFVIPAKQRNPAAESGAPTFTRAAIAYMRAGGDGSYLALIIKKWPTKLLSEVDQIAIDTVAAELYPNETPATRNRQVYTPIAAVIHRAGIEKKIKRPKGWKGKKSMSWLEPEQAFALFKAADKLEPEFGLFCRFLCYTGLRLDEALSRELRHLNLDRAFLYLEDSKNEEPRGCHLPPWLVAAFKSQPPRKMRDEVITAVVPGVKGFVKGGKGVGRHLVDAGVPFLKRKSSAKLFRFHDGGALRDLLKKAMSSAGLSFPWRQGGFHIFCHTYGTWGHRYGKLDRYGLTRTGRWLDPDSADRYVHTEASIEAKTADLFPTENDGQVMDLTSERKKA